MVILTLQLAVFIARSIDDDEGFERNDEGDDDDNYVDDIDESDVRQNI